MKKIIADSLKQITKGTFNSLGAVVFGIILGILVLCLIVASPAFLIWGLQLMGFTVPLTLKSWFGAMLVMMVMRARFGSNSSKSE